MCPGKVCTPSWSDFPLFTIRTHHRRAGLTGSPLATILASFTVDRLGRRRSLLGSPAS